MLEDEGLKKYVSWSKIKGKDAFVIPDIEAFVADALPTHFEEMKQKQLNNYDFKRQDRGPNKAVYAHAMFLQGRPDLLANVRSGNTPLTSGSQTDSPSYNDQLEHDNKELKRTVSELEVRVQTLETRLQLMETREQLKESSKRPEGISTEDRALDSVVDPGSAQSVHQIDALHRALIASVDTGGEALGYQFGPLQTLSWEAYPTKESAYDPVDPPLGLGFGPLQTLPWEAYLTTELLNDPVDPLFGLEFLAP
ncbi:hypothetical protein FRC00_004364 [Tulasnella sp. 408]|nr:hypothetical protein FRC00_004364 [Tulasnella sp. 408]